MTLVTPTVPTHAPTQGSHVGRLRRSAALRDSLRETRLDLAQLVAPLFVVEDPGHAGPVESLPGVHREAVDDAVARAEALWDRGVRQVLLFGLPAGKDALGSSSWDPDGPVCRVTRELAARRPELAVLTDVCLCQYTDHGHCLSAHHGTLDPAASLEAYARTAAAHARAGARVVAPSCRVDGAVAAIRRALDDDGRTDVGILSYAAKFASSLYGPFRDAAGSTPIDGDRAAHQLDPANRREAVRQALADADEGADALMVKPAGLYLDVLAELRRRSDLPLAAYQVSGEYAQLHAAAERGWLDLEAARDESLLALRRAGADLVITYFTKAIAEAEAGR